MHLIGSCAHCESRIRLVTFSFGIEHLSRMTRPQTAPPPYAPPAGAYYAAPPDYYTPSAPGAAAAAGGGGGQQQHVLQVGNS